MKLGRHRHIKLRSLSRKTGCNLLGASAYITGCGTSGCTPVYGGMRGQEDVCNGINHLSLQSGLQRALNSVGCALRVIVFIVHWPRNLSDQ